MNRWRDQRGVAMATVLMVGATLTAVASTATYVAIDEFSASESDRNAAAALSFAESGIERMSLKIRNGDLTWNEISRSGCDADHPLIQISGTNGTGSYTTRLEPYDPAAATPANRFPPASCPPTNQDPNAVRGVNEFVVTSTGVASQGTRVVRQVLEIKPLGLPIGIYAYERVDANGTVNMENINMVSEGSIFNRDNLGFIGVDPYYKIDDFYGNEDPAFSGYKMPASVHAVGTIYYGPASRLIEHRAGEEPNCGANVTGKVGQSLWDGSGSAVLTSIGNCANWLGAGNKPPAPASEEPAQTAPPVRPPTSKFTEADRRRVAPEPSLSDQDYLTLRTAAKQTGLYCSGAVVLRCSKAGGPLFTLTANQLDAAHIDTSSNPANPITARSFVVYIDFANNGADPLLRSLSWTGGADIGPCATTPATNRSAVIVVRRGSVNFSGGAEINGALIVPEGAVQSSGVFTVEGTVIARRIDVRGTATLRLSPCWLANLPGPFLDVSSTVWTEVDR